MPWVNDSAELDPQPDSNMIDWLTQPRHLKQALEQLAIGTLTLLQQGYAALTAEEQTYCQVTEPAAWVRQTSFSAQGQRPKLFAHVFVPLETYREHQVAFDTLGERPIGRTLLYNNAEVTRSTFSYMALHPAEPLYHRTQEVFNIKPLPPPHVLFGRRSSFNWSGKLLGIIEVFAPDMPAYRA